MLPYFPQPSFQIAGQQFHAFGAMVGLAVVAGCWFFLWRTRKVGLDVHFAQVFIVTVAVAAIFVSHLIGVALTDPRMFLDRPWSALNPAQSIYSFGGLVGGVLTAGWLLRRYRISTIDRWRYFDNLTFAFNVGWIFGRAGCTLAHDHIGVASNSFLAIRFPDGPHYDLGLLEMIFTILLVGAFVVLDRQPRPPGLFLGLFFSSYGSFRLWRDAMELHSTRYSGVSVDQLFAITCIAVGLFFLIRLVRQSAHAMESRLHPAL